MVKKKSTNAATKSSSTTRKKTLGSFTQDPAIIERLKDQRTVQEHLNAVHLNRRLLDEMAFYPAHDKRFETSEYKAVHEKLVGKLDLPCLICGVKKSTLKNKDANPYAAKQMETHHHVIEWALANAIDTDRFNAILLPNLAHRHSNRPEYARPFTQEQIRDWVDHSEDNLWVLCDVHHRARFFGIHEITFPIWGPMDLLRQDFVAYVNAQVALQKATKNPAKKTAKKTPRKVVHKTSD